MQADPVQDGTRRNRTRWKKTSGTDMQMWGPWPKVIKIFKMVQGTMLSVRPSEFDVLVVNVLWNLPWEKAFIHSFIHSPIHFIHSASSCGPTLCQFQITQLLNKSQVCSRAGRQWVLNKCCRQVYNIMQCYGIERGWQFSSSSFGLSKIRLQPSIKTPLQVLGDSRATPAC